jgi:hypothetical protein
LFHNCDKRVELTILCVSLYDFAEGYYSSNPYRYAAPMDPYRSRYDVMYGPRYGYRPGYGGYMSNGYGYGYGGGMGMGMGGGAMLGLGAGALLGAAMF